MLRRDKVAGEPPSEKHWRGEPEPWGVLGAGAHRGGGGGKLEEIRYCAYGCFSSVVAALCIKHDVLLTEPGWMLPGSGFPFSAGLGRPTGEEGGGCGLLSYLLSPPFSFPPPPPSLPSHR